MRISFIATNVAKHPRSLWSLCTGNIIISELKCCVELLGIVTYMNRDTMLFTQLSTSHSGF